MRNWVFPLALASVSCATGHFDDRSVSAAEWRLRGGDPGLTLAELRVLESAFRDATSEVIDPLLHVELVILTRSEGQTIFSQGRTVHISLAFARALLSCPAHDPDCLAERPRLLSFVFAHELGHIVSQCGGDACTFDADCEAGADQRAAEWLGTEGDYSRWIGRLRLLHQQQRVPDEPEARVVSCLQDAELEYRRALMLAHDATAGGQGDSEERRRTNEMLARAAADAMRNVPAIVAACLAASGGPSACAVTRARGLTDASTHAVDDLEHLDATAYMSSEAQWTGDSLLYVRGSAGSAYPILQQASWADAAWTVMAEAGFRFRELPTRDYVFRIGAIVNVMGYVRRSETSAEEVLALSVGGVARAPFVMLRPFAITGALHVAWGLSAPNDRLIIGIEVAGEVAAAPWAHLSLAGYYRFDWPDGGAYAYVVGALLGIQLNFLRY